jgi:hypothetical protein
MKGQFDDEKALLSLKTGIKDLQALLPAKFEDLEKIESPTIGTIRKYQGDAVCRAAICHLVYWVRDSFNFGRNLNDIQANTFADLLIGEWYALTLADVKLCFTEGIKGTYGQIYQNVDPTTLFGWIKAYFNAKEEYLVVKDRTAKKEQEKILTSEQVQEKWSQLLQNIESNRPTTQKSSLFYRSLAHYCEVNEKDLAKATNYLRAKYTDDWNMEDADIKKSVPVEAYVQYRIQRFLINKTKADAGRIIEKENVGTTITLDEYKEIKADEKRRYENSK